MAAFDEMNDTPPPGADFRDGYDEAWASPQVPRAAYADVLPTLSRFNRLALRSRTRLHLSRGGVTFGSDTGGTPFVVDPVPRVITADEWAVLAPGLAQRVRALEAFVHDAYGVRRIVGAGLISAQTIDEAEGYEHDLVGRLPDGPVAIGVAGLDVVRDRDGTFLVLQDNVRTPSGFAYAAPRAVRSSVSRCRRGRGGRSPTRPSPRSKRRWRRPSRRAVTPARASC